MASTAKLAASFERNFIFASFDVVERTFDSYPERGRAPVIRAKFLAYVKIASMAGRVSDLANI
ncbi:MAG: hypothetical protein ACTHLH_02675 [Solirubrobacterales bacterium]